MTKTSVDAATGALLVNGKRVFPIGLSDPPPLSGSTPNGGAAWAEIARAGVTFVRNYTVWTASGASRADDLARARARLGHEHGLQVWAALAGVDNDLSRQRLLNQIVDHAEGPSRTRRLERGRRAGTRTCAGIAGASRSTGTCGRSTPTTPLC